MPLFIIRDVKMSHFYKHAKIVRIQVIVQLTALSTEMSITLVGKMAAPLSASKTVYS